MCHSLHFLVKPPYGLADAVARCAAAELFAVAPLTAYQQKRAGLSTARWLYSFFRVKIIPMIAPIKIIGATLTNSHSNECNATPRTAVSGLL